MLGSRHFCETGEGEVSTFWKLPWGCVNNSYIARSPRSFPGRVQGSYPP